MIDVRLRAEIGRPRRRKAKVSGYGPKLEDSAKRRGP